MLDHRKIFQLLNHESKSHDCLIVINLFLFSPHFFALSINIAIIWLQFNFDLATWPNVVVASHRKNLHTTYLAMSKRRISYQTLVYQLRTLTWACLKKTSQKKESTKTSKTTNNWRNTYTHQQFVKKVKFMWFSQLCHCEWNQLEIK